MLRSISFESCTSHCKFIYDYSFVRALKDNLGEECVCQVEGDEVINALPSLFLKASQLVENKKKRGLENCKDGRRVDLEFNGGQKAADMICSFLESNK